MTDYDSQSTSAPQVWGDLSSEVFGWSPGWPLPFANLVELKAIGDGSNSVDPMSDGEHVRLRDGTTAWYDGAVWSAGVAPDAAPVAEGAAAPSPLEDPSSYVISDVTDAVEAAPDPCAVIDSVRTLEEAGSNRVTLVTWLNDYEADNCSV